MCTVHGAHLNRAPPRTEDGMLVLGLQTGAVSLVDETDGEEMWREKDYVSHYQRRAHHRHRPHLSHPWVCVAVPPYDRSRIASVQKAGNNWTLRDTDRGMILSSSLHAPAAGLETVVFSPCGTMLATTSAASRLDVFDARSSHHLWSVSTTPAGVADCNAHWRDKLDSASFSAHSTYIAAVCLGGRVHIRSAHTGTPVRTIEMHGRGEFSPAYNHLFATVTVSSLALWNVDTEQTVWQHGPSGGDLGAAPDWGPSLLRFAPDGGTIAYMQPDAVPRDHTQAGLALNPAPWDEEADTGQDDVQLVDAATGGDRHSAVLRAAQVPDRNGTTPDDRDGSVPGDQEGTADDGDGQLPNDIRDMAWSPDGRKLACVGLATCPVSPGHGRSGVCVVWDAPERTVLCRIHSGATIASVAWARDYKQEERRLALAMGLHKRLGEASGVKALDPDLLRLSYPDAVPPPSGAGPALFEID